MPIGLRLDADRPDGFDLDAVDVRDGDVGERRIVALLPVLVDVVEIDDVSHNDYPSS